MIPTFFSALAVGTITALTPVIMALTAWIPGSAILNGNLFFDTTSNSTPAIYLGSSQVMKITQTGTALISQGISAFQSWFIPCTNTGGLAKYPTCYARSPFTTTGALIHVALECGNTNKQLSASGGFVKSSDAPVLSSFPTIRTVTVGTGSAFAYNARATSGSYVQWNPADAIKVQTVTSMPAGGINCGLHIDASDKYGN